MCDLYEVERGKREQVKDHQQREVISDAILVSNPMRRWTALAQAVKFFSSNPILNSNDGIGNPLGIK